MRVAIVGSTGLVGSVLLKVLEERAFPVSQLIPVASEKSIGKEVLFKNKPEKIVGILQAISLKPDVAIFSAGSAISKEWAPKFVEAGSIVIDNSSAWRMDPRVMLVVPEINGHLLTDQDKLIANPNCSTIQMVAALAPLHKSFGLKRIVVSTYQSVTGTGINAVKQMNAERQGEATELVYPHPIDLNCFPHGGDFLENGYTTEEMKLVEETQKILGSTQIEVTATVVRIPVVGGHSEAVTATFEKDFELENALALLKETPGLALQDEPSKNQYPMPKYAEGKDEVFVGRLRKDLFAPRTLNLWVVSDNLRKGAATNAVQIAEHLLQRKIINS